MKKFVYSLVALAAIVISCSVLFFVCWNVVAGKGSALDIAALAFFTCTLVVGVSIFAPTAIRAARRALEHRRLVRMRLKLVKKLVELNREIALEHYYNYRESAHIQSRIQEKQLKKVNARLVGLNNYIPSTPTTKVVSVNWNGFKRIKPD